MEKKKLDDYYTDLHNNINKELALKEIDNLSLILRFEIEFPLRNRLIVLKNTMQQYISSFRAAAKHIDMIDLILKTLNVCAMNFTYGLNNDDLGDPRTSILSTLVTLFDMCEETTVHSYLLHPLFAQSPWSMADIETQVSALDKLSLDVVMIIFKDADLYAVIYYIAYYMSDNLNHCELWVHEGVKLKFLWLLERHCVICKYYIKSFQSLKDIQYEQINIRIMRILSIWSENILSARNLAMSSIHDMVFINCYMDWPNCTASLPYFDVLRRINVRSTKIHINSQRNDIEKSKKVTLYSSDVEKNCSSIYNLFYDDKWQKPVNGLYWKHNNNLFANATRQDIVRCYTSAEKAFETWSTMSIIDRLQILSKLVPLLKTSNNLLATIVERWIKFPYLYEIEYGTVAAMDNQIDELIEVRMAVGIIILVEKSETVLFFRLIQNLVVGNTVIVLFDSRVSSLITYFDIFSACGIPPGVVNLLSHENVDVLDTYMCPEHYLKLRTTFFLKATGKKESYIEPYRYLTTSKYILINLGHS